LVGFALLPSRCKLILSSTSNRHIAPGKRRTILAGYGARGSLPKSQARNGISSPSLGRRVAVLSTKTFGRVLAPGLSMLNPRLPDDVAARSRLSTTWHGFEGALDEFIQGNLVAART
jgi:hypothetical protein